MMTSLEAVWSDFTIGICVKWQAALASDGLFRHEEVFVLASKYLAPAYDGSTWDLGGDMPFPFQHELYR